MTYRPTFAEFVRYWEPSSDDSLTLFLAGAYMCAMAVGFIVS